MVRAESCVRAVLRCIPSARAFYHGARAPCLLCCCCRVRTPAPGRGARAPRPGGQRRWNAEAPTGVTFPAPRIRPTPTDWGPPPAALRMTSPRSPSPLPLSRESCCRGARAAPCHPAAPRPPALAEFESRTPVPPPSPHLPLTPAPRWTFGGETHVHVPPPPLLGPRAHIQYVPRNPLAPVHLSPRPPAHLCPSAPLPPCPSAPLPLYPRAPVPLCPSAPRAPQPLSPLYPRAPVPLCPRAPCAPVPLCPCSPSCRHRGAMRCSGRVKESRRSRSE